MSICLTVSLYLYICLQFEVFENSQLLTSSFIYVSLVSGLELKTWQLCMYQNASEFFRKIRGRHYCQGLGQKSVCSNNKYLLVLLDMCSMVVLWNVFLSVQSSLFVSAWMWTTTLQYNYSTLENISKCFNIWIKCFEIMFQRLEVLICFFEMDMYP